MTLPNPEEILKVLVFENNPLDLPPYTNELWENYKKERPAEFDVVLKAMKEYGAQLLRAAADEADVECENPLAYPEFQRYRVDKESILSIIKEL